jgi:hypothetical protein
LYASEDDAGMAQFWEGKYRTALAELKAAAAVAQRR